MRPPGPVPAIALRSMPSAAATRAATGEILASSATTGAACGAAAPLPDVSTGAGRAAPAPTFIRAMTWPTVTVSPSSARISVIVPAVGAGSSMSTLSVEISTTAWPSCTSSPTLTDHSRIVPSVTDSPPAGVTMSTISPLPAASGSASVAGASGSVCGSAAGASGSVTVRAPRVGLRLGGRRLGLGDRGGRRAVLGGDLGEDRADAHGVAFGDVDLDHGARGGRRDVGVDLVGGDLDEGLVGLDRVPLLFVPLQDGALGHRLAHLRQGDLHCGVDRHCSGFRL